MAYFRLLVLTLAICIICSTYSYAEVPIDTDELDQSYKSAFQEITSGANGARVALFST